MQQYPLIYIKGVSSPCRNLFDFLKFAVVSFTISNFITVLSLIARNDSKVIELIAIGKT